MSCRISSFVARNINLRRLLFVLRCPEDHRLILTELFRTRAFLLLCARMKNASLRSYKSAQNPTVTIYEKIEDIKGEISRLSPSAPSKPPTRTPSPTPVKVENVKLETHAEETLELKTPQKSKPNTRKRKKLDVTAAGNGNDSPSNSPRKSKAIRLTLETPHPTPENWEEVYAAIKEMRKHGGAPVDEMGCHMAGGPVEDPKVCFVFLG